MSEQPPDDDVGSDPAVQRVHAWLHAGGTLAGEDVERVMSRLHHLSDRRSVRVRGLVPGSAVDGHMSWSGNVNVQVSGL